MEKDEVITRITYATLQCFLENIFQGGRNTRAFDFPILNTETGIWARQGDVYISNTHIDTLINYLITLPSFVCTL